jgi:hypothetical protein
LRLTDEAVSLLAREVLAALSRQEENKSKEEAEERQRAADCLTAGA